MKESELLTDDKIRHTVSRTFSNKSEYGACFNSNSQTAVIMLCTICAIA